MTTDPLAGVSPQTQLGERTSANPAEDAREHARKCRANDALIIDRLVGRLHELPRREVEVVLAAASFRHEADQLRLLLYEVMREHTTAGRKLCDFCGEWSYPRRRAGSSRSFVFARDCEICFSPLPEDS